MRSIICLWGQYVSYTYTSKLEPVFRKKSSSVCYHAVHESVAMGKSIFEHVPSKKNVADLMIKVLYRQKRKYLVSNILYVILDDH